MRIAKTRIVKTPTRSTEFSAGLDFYVPQDFTPYMLISGEDIIVPLGIKADIPKGYILMAAETSEMASSKSAKERAGLNPNKGTSSSLSLGARIVDEDYQGEIRAHVINTGRVSVVIRPDMRIAQFILVPVKREQIEVVPEESLYNVESMRGDKGFGEADKTATQL